MLQNPSVDVSNVNLPQKIEQLLNFFRVNYGYNFTDAQNLTFLTRSYRPKGINKDIIPLLLEKIQEIGRHLLRGAIGILSFRKYPESTKPGILSEFRDSIENSRDLMDTYEVKLISGYNAYISQLKKEFPQKKEYKSLNKTLPLLSKDPPYTIIYSLITAVFIDSNFNFELLVTFVANLFEINGEIDVSSSNIFPYQKEFRAMEREIKYSFKNKFLKSSALNIQRFNLWGKNRNLIVPGFQVLEFLGDSILGIVIAVWVIKRLAIEKITEKTISGCEIQSYVETPFLHEVGAKRGIVKLFEALRDGYDKERVADSVEAIIGAIYLDTNQDFEVTYRETLVLLSLDKE